jgi:hypothetical protein
MGPRSLTAAVLATLLVAASRPSLYAEVFVLKTGGRVEGQPLNPERTPGQPYVLQTGGGVRLALAESAVQRVIVKTDLDKQYEELVRKLPNTAADHWALAEWCKEAGLNEQRNRHLQAVIKLEPDHAEARKALGYQRYGSRWLTPDEYMASLGYVRYKGAWRLRQEVEIDSRSSQGELAVKQWRRDIRRWLGHVANGDRYAEASERELNAINDPQAAPALAEILADSSQPRLVRERCLAILQRLPPGLATTTLAQIAMDDPDARVQSACLDELRRQGAHLATPLFVAQLKSKDNARINRAAECLLRLEDKSAALPLINALVTEHRRTIQQGPPGGMSATFSPSGSGGSPGLAMGKTTKVIKEKLKNQSVRSALCALFPGTDFQFDVDAWRTWYSQSQAETQLDLRRDE